MTEIDETPMMSSDDRPHILDSDCWCNPTIEYVEGKRRHHSLAPSMPGRTNHDRH